ncbi:MAG: GNAT family N-acetyltransferase [Candidatus Harrisonbacteria bacterium]|nr:GNAT family N-acetyltransferase [Candidatus Harrisonbacteria bacterium]
MNFVFTNDYPASKIDEVISYLLGPRLWIPQNDYPDFFDWAQKVHTELKKESKRALVAVENKEIVGVTIYQKHKRHPDALEIKNLTVRPDKRGRYIASFLLRNSETEGVREFRSKFILCDAKSKNLSIRYFLTKNHYQISGKDDLYGKNAGDDIIYKKYV